MGSSSVIKTFITTLQKYAQRAWYLPLMGFFTFMTLFVAVLPSEVLVVKTVLLRPKRWMFTVIFMAACSGLAAFVFAVLVKKYGEAALTGLLGDQFLISPSWLRTKASFDRFGAFAVFLFALSPFPMQFGIAAAALGEHSPLLIASLAFFGRVLKFSGYAYLALKTPHVWQKFRRKFSRNFPEKKKTL